MCTLGNNIKMFKQLIYLALLLLSVNSLANEKKPLKQTTVFNETFSWQGQLGFSLSKSTFIIDGIEEADLGNNLNISLLFDVYYKGFFIQSNHRRADSLKLGAELGYQLIVEDDWELDIIHKSYFGGFNPEDIIARADKEIPILAGLKQRDSANGLGLRYSRYYQESILSVDVAAITPFSDDSASGWLINAFYSHIVPYRNWDIYLNTSVTYYSEDVIDYYTGVDASEVSPIREKYKGEHALRAQFEIFAQRPISRSWTFNAGLSHSFYTANIKNSPIVDSQGASQIMVGVLYVF